MRLARFAMLALTPILLNATPLRAAAPALPTQWVNSPPMTLDDLSGKLVVLYYFEETCPTCRGKWPAMLTLAKSMAEQPILFVGVNSGNSAADVAKYAKSVKVDWPIIVDVDRSFEGASGLAPPISLQNIMQVNLITPEGELARGNWSDIPSSVTRHVGKARWRREPGDIPAALVPAWRQLEFANYSGAAATLAKIKPADDAAKQAAAKLSAAVTEEFDRRMAAAKALADGGEKWPAYKAYADVQAAFKALPESAKAAKQAGADLARDSQVAREIKAASLVKVALRGRTIGTPAQRKRAEETLGKLATEYADTEAGKLAANPPMP